VNPFDGNSSGGMFQEQMNVSTTVDPVNTNVLGDRSAASRLVRNGSRVAFQRVSWQFEALEGSRLSSDS
jgi:hypothetical protein